MKIKPELGVCYYPEHWPESLWDKDAKRMRQAGLSWVRIGEFAWSRLEPEEGSFDWAWLERAIAILSAEGLHICLGTPSATPPRWMLDKFPDMEAVDQSGQPRKFGSRRHYDFAHQGYRAAAAKMAAKMAQRFDTQVQAWQIDNEYGCHDTTVSYSDTAQQAFQQWLQDKYHTPEALNTAWGNVFWSMEYRSFSEIALPNLTVTEPNPAHVLDFRRFASDQVIAFNRAQVDAIRLFSDKPCIHNYMGRVTDFDHFALGEDLDIASWDSYPVGFLEMVLEEDAAWKNRFSRQGDPDFQAFHHDLYRAVGKGQLWIMEQQPGPVNWANWNPIPMDGMVRLWSLEAIAHGASVVSYFRWRQAPFAQEQMHAGLLRPDDAPAPGLQEVQQLVKDLAQLQTVQQQTAEVALVFDYPSQWAWETQPQGQDFDYFRLLFDYYRALRRLGLSVDILPSSTQDFDEYKLVIIAGLCTWQNTALKEAVANFSGTLLLGPRSALKTANMQIDIPLGPQIPGVDVQVTRLASLRPGVTMPLSQGGEVRKWFEELAFAEDKQVQALEHTVDGQAVWVGSLQRSYIGAWLSDDALLRVLKRLAQHAEIQTYDMPEGVRQRHTQGRRFVFNYNAETAFFAGQKLSPAEVLLLEDSAYGQQ